MARPEAGRSLQSGTDQAGADPVAQSGGPWAGFHTVSHGVDATSDFILSRLPHGPPALLLTSASLSAGGDSCRGVRDAGEADPSTNPEGFLPSCLLVELMAQTAGLVLPEEATGALVAAIGGMCVRRAARRGERVEVRARLERRIGALFLFDCRAEAAGRLLARGSITLRAL